MDKDKIASKLRRSVLIGFAGLNLLGAGKVSARENNGDVVFSSSKFKTEVFRQSINSEDDINKSQAMRRTYHYSAHQQNGGVSQGDKQSVSQSYFSNRENLGDGYTFISVSSKYKHTETEKSSKLAYMVTPDGKCLDCSFIDNNKFVYPKSVRVNEDGSISKSFENNLDERRMAVANVKVFNGFIKQAAERGFSEDELRHLGVHLKNVKDNSESNNLELSNAKVLNHTQVLTQSFSRSQSR